MSVYVDLQYDKISLTLMLGLCDCVVFVVVRVTALSVSLCCVRSHVVVFGLSLRLLWHPMWMWWL